MLLSGAHSPEGRVCWSTCLWLCLPAHFPRLQPSLRWATRLQPVVHCMIVRLYRSLGSLSRWVFLEARSHEVRLRESLRAEQSAVWSWCMRWRLLSSTGCRHSSACAAPRSRGVRRRITWLTARLLRAPATGLLLTLSLPAHGKLLLGITAIGCLRWSCRLARLGGQAESARA